MDLATTASCISIPTADGPCTTEVVVPGGPGPWPAVIVCYDAAGLRPAQTRIAQRIAAGGYLVYQPDLFHRSPPLSELVSGLVSSAAMRAVFQDPALRDRFMTEYHARALAYRNLEVTMGAVLQAIGSDARSTGRVGIAGYCLGGNAGMRAAAIFGQRIAAAAIIHPGGLVTDQPDSPHRHARTITARLHLALSSGDLPTAAEAALRAELDDGHVRYAIEHVAAQHGFAIDDGPSYDAQAAAQQHAALQRLFACTLRVDQA